MDTQLTELANADRSLFPPSLTIQAIRDSRYHNTAYAIAELIDNSFEANAERIELLLKEEPIARGNRTRRTVTEIGVLDSGEGMDVLTLFEALKFGGGTRRELPRGIGKYGMGLPTSSMSQCKRVDVWTWQDGPDSVWHSHIDARAIEQGDHNVPIPDQNTPIPAHWQEAGSPEIFEGRSGTLVVWRDLDKVQWKTARAIIDNTDRELGRIHRYFIEADITRIRMASFLGNRPYEYDLERNVIPNDPLYLMDKTSVPEPPWNDEPMFEQWGETKFYPVVIEGREETIEVKYSIVKQAALRTARITQNPGAAPRGKHARHNIGVSVVREDREIVLEDAFLREGGSSDNPQNRWWGCEVHFRRSCDELFGVDHNKQMVAHFTQAAKTLARDDRTVDEILDELDLDDDPIHRIVGDIRDQTNSMMREIRRMFSQRRGPRTNGNSQPPKDPESKAAKTATEADREAIESGEESPTQTDVDREEIPPTDRESGLAEQFEAFGQDDEDARALAKYLVEEGLAYQFNSDQLDGYQMFNVRSNQGVLHVNLNIDHPIYDLLRHVEQDLDENVEEDDPLFECIVALRLLLSSWARMEDHTVSADDRMRIQDTAMNWGRQVHKVITYLRERDG